MRAISLFSGIGGLDRGLEKAGIETVLQVEQDKHALAVLERHWPQVERLTDVRDLREGDACARRRGSGPLGADRARADAERERSGGGASAINSARDGTDGVDRRADSTGPAHLRTPSPLARSWRQRVDLIHGGFPCQDISVAGKRAGLSGERSGLWFEFARILEELRPRWCVIENVAGLLSSGDPPGADLGLILNTLVELGYGVAWRTLDAQHFGVPQRRRRVFIVGGPGDGTAASAVLAVGEGGEGHPAPGEEAREDAAVAAPLGSHSTGGYRNDLDNTTYVQDTAYALAARNAKGVSLLESQDNFVVNGGVRRLTPLEAERLMGLPDGWTEGQADTHRYRQLGNAVVVPVAEWIGHRLVRVDDLLAGRC